MFTSTHPFLPFDHLRVPYRVVPASGSPAVPGGAWARLHLTSEPGASLTWAVADDGARGGPRRRFRLGDAWLYGHVVADDVLGPELEGAGAGWRRAYALVDGAGRRVGSVWRAADGSVLVPFDPSDVVAAFWSERYGEAAVDGGRSTAARVRGAAMRTYYAVRPVMPRRVQIGMRRAYSRVQARSGFPRWPVEPSLENLLDRVLGWAAEVAGRPVPSLAPWPAGHDWAMVLTHDVETDEGLRRMHLLRAVEERTGVRSSWNFVPGRYAVPDALVAELQASGNEVGLHGLHHDGRDLEPGHFERRLPAMREHAARWGAVGFRSPATHRAWDTMSRLPFSYDSSYPDTDPYEPQPGGCCSVLPFFDGDVVELPITLAQDHTLFVILRARDARTWLDKAAWIRERGGLALLITHPDYVGVAGLLPAYEELLRTVAADPSVWRPLPKEAADWWRRRAASEITEDGEGWTVEGPAAGEASIRWTRPGEAAGEPGAERVA